ncbi:hypothetical protein NEF87_001078 [Candidatus Lokiarchaeum ossiferum]|uniref:Uncharacterized protein n=1 Tax=Candidatus Lokiarchaeum ossiferum TaxID=2951803 RepID=A0ABY6HNB1_9ARCH|nr:hypothetical protein NEF87_001078 [Candidatus Lokiarchaeum sp. B-35]
MQGDPILLGKFQFLLKDEILIHYLEVSREIHQPIDQYCELEVPNKPSNARKVKSLDKN